jgi:hypothetical protein
MQTLFSLILEIALVAITVSIIQLLVLVFRNAHRPQWLRHGFAESVAVIGIVMGITLSVATLVAGLVGAGVNVFVTLVVAAMVPLAVAFVNDRLFRVRDRLRRAETGASPFAPLADHTHRAKV